MHIHSILSRVLLSLFALWLVLPASPIFAQEKAYVYERIDVVVNVHDDGLLEVTETMTFKYIGGPFSSAVREIPYGQYKKLDTIRNVAVREGEQTYDVGSIRPGTYSAALEHPVVRIEWYYEPTSDTSRTFTVSYEVEGAIRVGDALDELWWVAIFPERDVPVEQSSIIVNLPEGVDLDQVQVHLPAEEGRVSKEGRSISVVRDEPLPGGTSLDVQVRLPSALIDAPESGWQRSETSDTSTTTENRWPVLPIFIVLGMFLLILFLFLRSTSHGKRGGNSSRGYYSSVGDGGSYSGGHSGGDGGSGGGGGGAD